MVVLKLDSGFMCSKKKEAQSLLLLFQPPRFTQ